MFPFPHFHPSLFIIKHSHRLYLNLFKSIQHCTEKGNYCEDSIPRLSTMHKIIQDSRKIMQDLVTIILLKSWQVLTRSWQEISMPRFKQSYARCLTWENMENSDFGDFCGTCTVMRYKLSSWIIKDGAK